MQAIRCADDYGDNIGKYAAATNGVRRVDGGFRNTENGSGKFGCL